MKRLGLLVLGAAVLAGCGASDTPRTRIAGRTLRIYLSVPLTGAARTQGQAVARAAEMALADHHERLGRYRVVLSVLDDATVASRGWDPSQVTANARAAAQDPTTVGYLGDLDSGATAISIPLLNRAGVAQVSPWAGAVGLTTAGPGASPGEPQKYYPAGVRTFTRVVPSDAAESTALVSLQMSLGCRAPFVLQDGEIDGEDGAISYVLTAQARGLRVLGVQSFQRLAPDYSSLAASLAQARTDCVLLESADERSAARLVSALGRALPTARMFASSQLADPAFADPAGGGVPLGLDPRVLVLAPGRARSGYPPAGRAFLDRYGRRYGTPPPQAIFGYAAMSLMLNAIARATDGGRATAERTKVVQAMFATRGWRGVLGPLNVARSGDGSLRGFAVFRLVGGQLSFWQQIG